MISAFVKLKASSFNESVNEVNISNMIFFSTVRFCKWCIFPRLLNLWFFLMINLRILFFMRFLLLSYWFPEHIHLISCNYNSKSLHSSFQLNLIQGAIMAYIHFRENVKQRKFFRFEETMDLLDEHFFLKFSWLDFVFKSFHKFLCKRIYLNSFLLFSYTSNFVNSWEVWSNTWKS